VRSDVTTIEVMQVVAFCRSEQKHVFSVMRGLCHVCISEPNSEASNCESEENGNTATYNGEYEN
jgi:hypothetical protein